MTTPNIVSGSVSTVTDLGKDEVWLQGWLKEQPTRLGLGELEVADAADDDDRAFAATDEDRCFSVDVQLGEMEASRGFGVLDNWARNRVRHPDKTHVAVLVTESIGDRYQTTFETLAEHLPLVVVELQVWLGEDEAIVVPHVALSSDDVDLSSTPAAAAAEAVSRVEGTESTESAESAESTDYQAEADSPAESFEADATADEAETVVPENKDDTGVSDPWGLPQADAEADTSEFDSSGASESGESLLSKIGS